MSEHRIEAERLLEMIDTSNLTGGDLATAALAEAVLAVDDSLTNVGADLVQVIENLTGVISESRGR